VIVIRPKRLVSTIRYCIFDLYAGSQQSSYQEEASSWSGKATIAIENHSE